MSNNGVVICSKSITDKISLEGIKNNNLNINCFMSESENTCLIIKSKDIIQNEKKINMNIYRESLFSNIFLKFKYLITNPKIILRKFLI